MQASLLRMAAEGSERWGAQAREGLPMDTGDFRFLLNQIKHMIPARDFQSPRYTAEIEAELRDAIDGDADKAMSFAKSLNGNVTIAIDLIADKDIDGPARVYMQNEASGWEAIVTGTNEACGIVSASFFLYAERCRSAALFLSDALPGVTVVDPEDDPGPEM